MDADLTTREAEVLRLIIAGYSNKQIAHELQLSIKTVSTHRSHIMSKLEVHNAASLVAQALRFGLITMEPERKQASAAWRR
jgi:DNA-binding NarL/FixJ family response regulator